MIRGSLSMLMELLKILNEIMNSLCVKELWLLAYDEPQWQLRVPFE